MSLFLYSCTINKHFLFCSPQKVPPIFCFVMLFICLIHCHDQRSQQEIHAPHHGHQDLQYLAPDNFLDFTFISHHLHHCDITQSQCLLNLATLAFSSVPHICQVFLWGRLHYFLLWPSKLFLYVGTS